MYYISDFCHICLQYEKSLIKLGQKESQTDEIVAKLRLCVSEVEWNSNKTLSICNLCLQKLNSAYDFKQQCIKATNALTNYIMELKRACKRKLKGKLNVALSRDVSKELINEYVESSKEETKVASLIHIVPEQKIFSPLTKLIVTNASQGPFQNLYLNLIPTSMLNLSKSVSQPPTLKPGPQNMFIMGNINNTVRFHENQFRPQVNNVVSDINVSQILNNSKSEELSIEVDPTVFDYGIDGDTETQEKNVDSKEKDWDEIISSNKISQASVLPVPVKNPEVRAMPVPVAVHQKVNSVNNYVPVCPPKVNNRYNLDITNEEKMEFFNFGHFLTNPQKLITKSYNMNMQCDTCSQCFDTIRSLRHHIKQAHNGNFPYKCGSCLAEFALRTHYESHVQKHTADHSDTLLANSITLENIKDQTSDCFLNPAPELQNGNKEYRCDVCERKFSTSQGLIRHKVRRHDEQKVRTKYFVKGMKNAKCNVCDRSFSTQSYLQLHLKLHNRKGDWKRKIYNKEKAKKESEQEADTEMIVDEKLTDNENEEDSASIPSPDVVENNPVEITDNASNNKPVEENRGLKIKINLKDIARIQEEEEEDEEEEADQSEENDDVEDIEVIPDTSVESSVGVNEEIGEQIHTSHFDDVSTFDNVDQQDSNFDSICLSEDTAQLQNQNANVFKFEWIDGKPKCIYCDKMFGRKHDLKRHINNVHMKSIQYKCHICKRKFYEGFHLTRHLRGHYSSLACPQCNKKFCTITDIKNHLIVSHDGIGNIDCGVCNISFDDIVILKDHIEEHLKTIIYKCHICDDEYRECRDLTKHIVEHSGVYTCNQCNRNFCTEKELISHLRIHSSEASMRHKCEICQNTFKKKRYLYSHLKNCHSIEKQEAEILIDTIDTVACEYSNPS